MEKSIDNYPIFVTKISKQMSNIELKDALLNRRNEITRKKLINENLWIVEKIILTNFADRNDKDELMSVGASALIDYIDKYDEKNNNDFYESVKEYIKNVLNQYIEYGKNIASLDELIEKGNDEYIGFNPDFEVDIEKIFLDKISDNILFKKLSLMLTEREKDILIKYCYENQTFYQIAKKYNLSVAKVSQMMHVIGRKVHACIRCKNIQLDGKKKKITRI